MAGINEHNEARRVERVYLRKAWLQKAQQRAYAEKSAQNEGEMEMLANGQRPPSTYEKQLGVMRGDSPQFTRDTDSARREALRRQQTVDYSAKIPYRFSSTDYKSQW